MAQWLHPSVVAFIFSRVPDFRPLGDDVIPHMRTGVSHFGTGGVCHLQRGVHSVEDCEQAGKCLAAAEICYVCSAINDCLLVVLDNSPKLRGHLDR